MFSSSNIWRENSHMFSQYLLQHFSQGLPHPTSLWGKLFKLWCSQGALIHLEGDPGETILQFAYICNICMFDHTRWTYFELKLSSQKFVIITIKGDHGQAKGRRRRCRHWERLEVCGHGARQALPHHLHRLHCHRHCRRPRCRAARYRNLDTNSI